MSRVLTTQRKLRCFLVFERKEVRLVLDERKRKILQAIVEDYVASAEPIGSRSLSKSHALGISAATIRNEMSDLEELGYLDQPHTSAGRIPSGKGYRFYVDQLLPRKQITSQEISFIEKWYEERVGRIEEAFSETARLVSAMTGNLAVVLNQTRPTFRYLQFLPFDDANAILVLVADNGIVENQMMNIPPGLSYFDLERLGKALNHRYSGQSFQTISNQVAEEIAHSIVNDPILLQQAMLEFQKVMSKEQGRKVYLGGASQLVDQPEFRENMGRIRSLLGLLEEEREIFEIFTQETRPGLSVTIGQENQASSIQDCSVVQGTYQLGDQIIGRIAIIGPTRMEYQRAVSVMEYMQVHMEEMMKRYLKG